MDLATILGLLIGFGALFGCLVIEGGKIGELFNISAMLLVFGGTFGASLIGCSLKQMLGAVGVAKNAFFNKAEDPREVIKQIVEFTRKARREGILVLEEEARNIDNRILRTGIQLIVDGTPDEIVRNILETEVLVMQERHKQGSKIFDTMGGVAPTMGVIGTVMGLVNMLNNMSDPGRMGPMIAAAFIATLYGVSYANIVLLPLGQKLKSRSAEEVAIYEMMIEGILSIQAGDNPRIVETKMMAFLPPKLRGDINTSEGA
jgi:chemotaxis protein MotA